MLLSSYLIMTELNEKIQYRYISILHRFFASLLNFHCYGFIFSLDSKLYFMMSTLKYHFVNLLFFAINIWWYLFSSEMKFWFSKLLRWPKSVKHCLHLFSKRLFEKFRETNCSPFRMCILLPFDFSSELFLTIEIMISSDSRSKVCSKSIHTDAILFVDSSDSAKFMPILSLINFHLSELYVKNC
jgi:hypothetical protein